MFANLRLRSFRYLGVDHRPTHVQSCTLFESDRPPRTLPDTSPHTQSRSQAWSTCIRRVNHQSPLSTHPLSAPCSLDSVDCGITVHGSNAARLQCSTKLWVVHKGRTSEGTYLPVGLLLSESQTDRRLLVGTASGTGRPVLSLRCRGVPNRLRQRGCPPSSVCAPRPAELTTNKSFRRVLTQCAKEEQRSWQCCCTSLTHSLSYL